MLLVAATVLFAVLRDRSASQSANDAQRRRAPVPEAHETESKSDRSREPAGKNARGRRIAPTSPFHSRAACEAHLASRPRNRARGPRIGTWNVRWFPYGERSRNRARRTDVAWLACAIASMDVDVLAVQEFVQDAGGRSALLDLRTRLDELTHGRWRDQLDDCSARGFQHVGFLYDSARVELRSVQTLGGLNPRANACAHGLRPGLGVYARFMGGPDLSLISLHLDSGIDARDFGHRERSRAALASVLPQLEQRARDPDLLLLGDFNTMGCSHCEPPVSAAAELAHMDEDLRALALARLQAPAEHTCSQYHRGKGGMLDHIVASADMQELADGARIEVFGPCRELACGPAAAGEDVDAWEHLSDHCPLVVELQARDLDG